MYMIYETAGDTGQGIPDPGDVPGWDEFFERTFAILGSPEAVGDGAMGEEAAGPGPRERHRGLLTLPGARRSRRDEKVA